MVILLKKFFGSKDEAVAWVFSVGEVQDPVDVEDTVSGLCGTDVVDMQVYGNWHSKRDCIDCRGIRRSSSWGMTRAPCSALLHYNRRSLYGRTRPNYSNANATRTRAQKFARRSIFHWTCGKVFHRNTSSSGR